MTANIRETLICELICYIRARTVLVLVIAGLLYGPVSVVQDLIFARALVVILVWCEGQATLLQVG